MWCEDFHVRLELGGELTEQVGGNMGAAEAGEKPERFQLQLSDLRITAGIEALDG